MTIWTHGLFARPKGSRGEWIQVSRHKSERAAQRFAAKVGKRAWIGAGMFWEPSDNYEVRSLDEKAAR